MVVVQNQIIRDIPVLQVVRREKEKEQLPLVVFIHGFTSVKENNLHYAYLLANKGMRVVLPEAVYHGERDVGLSGEKLMQRFWNIVIQSIHELPVIKEAYEEKALIRKNKIGLVGTSMGGIITLGALTQYDWISSAVSLMGVPSYSELAKWQIDEIKKNHENIALSKEEIEYTLKQLKPYDLSLQPEKLNKRPLLFWHGKKDPIVPYKYAFEFYNEMKRRPQMKPDKLQFITDEQAGHKVSRDGVLHTVKWFEDTLA